MSDLPPMKSPSRELPILRLVFAIVLIASFALKLQNLGHPGIKALDESFHAVVATNLLKHPLTPTLIDKPYLPFDPTVWQDNTVWLHKPILPMWQMAGSMAIGSINTTAMRMPSAVLGTLSALLTYLIARRWIDERAGFVAGTLMAFCPMTWMLTHGYLFSDHVDISLLFWTEMGIWLLSEGMYASSLTGASAALAHDTDNGPLPDPPKGVNARAWRVYALFAGAGVAQGLAFLSKTFPALVVSGLAVVAIVLAAQWRGRSLKWSYLATLLGAAGVVVTPWLIYTYVQFREEFVAEYLQVFRHLSQSVEGFANPWDRILFDFWINAFYVFYPACLTAVILLAMPAYKEKSVGLVMTYAWMLGVLVPHLLSVSKTPSMTLIGWPPVAMLLGALVSRATRGDVLACAAVAVCGILGVGAVLNIHNIGGGAFAFVGGKPPRSDFGVYPPPFQLVRDSIWVVWHVALATVLAVAVWKLVNLRAALSRGVVVVAWVVAGLGGVVLSCEYARIAVRVTAGGVRQPDMSELGNFIRANAPENAVILIDLREKLEDKMLMFYAGRTCYGLAPSEPYALKAEQIRKAGGKVYLITHKQMPGKPLMVVQGQGRGIYEIK